MSTDRMPSVYLGHGAPPLVDDPIWRGELAAWAAALPRPKAILVISAHWENAPLTIGATTPVPLVYDFSGFPEKYYRVTYPAPGAPAPGWSKEFDAWAAETLARGDVDALVDYRRTAPGLPYAHPTVDHFVPLFVALGASLDETPRTVIDGYFLGLSKRSVEFA